MSGGIPSAHFSQPGLHASGAVCDAARNRLGRSAPAPLWTDPVSEMERIYARPPCVVVGGSMAHHVSPGVASAPSTLLPQCVEMRSAYMQSHAQAVVATAPFRLEGPACSRRESPSGIPFRAGPDPRQNLADTPNRDIVEPALGFAPANQTWGEMARVEFAPRAQPLFLPQVHSWESRESACIQPSSLVGNDALLVELAPLQNAEDDDDVYTLLCEWTDERGTCNMTVFGDRVWMSHHLSRRHNVVGHEKSQRACLWRGCTDTMNKGSLARHVVSRHLRAGASCEFCSKVYSRADVARRHAKKCKVANGATGQTKR